jgi:SPP1 family predicted phage head-tail adaptor
VIFFRLGVNTQMEALNDILFFISEGEKKEDEDGFEVEVPGEELEIFCAVKSVRQSEFYNALRNNKKVVQVFKVAFDEYSGQNNVKYDEKLYKVERTYRTDEYYIELSCSEVE